MSEDWRALNRANWDERVGVHLGPAGYDLAPLRAGGGGLDVIVESELSDVSGLRVLHLQCHFGRDSLVLARRGAEVTGIDFSPAAIEAARALAAELKLPARFIECELYDAPEAVPEPASFDLVYATWGTICWLPDIARWAETVAYFLRPGGALYFADAHPVAYVFDDMGSDSKGRPGWLVPYFGGEPLVHDDPADYADTRRQTRQLAPGELAASAGQCPRRARASRTASRMAARASARDVADVPKSGARRGRVLDLAGPRVVAARVQPARRARLSRAGEQGGEPQTCA